MDLYMFVSKAVICVAYVDDCMFWARSQSDTDNLNKSFKDNRPIYNLWNQIESQCTSS